MDWKSFLRQLLICSGTWVIYFMQGLNFGSFTVVVPQLRALNPNETITEDMAAWIPATYFYSVIPWILLLSALGVSVGRKKAHIVVCLVSCLSFTIFFFSINVTHILLCELFQSALGGAHFTNSIIILTEFTSNKDRGIFLTLKSAMFYLGMLVSNAIGTFLHFRNVGILGMICAVYSLVNVIFWPESPLWFATKGKFEECKKAHKWLKGEDEESEKELERLLKAHEHVKFLKPYWSSRKTFKSIKQRTFWMPLLLVLPLFCLYCFSGKFIITAFALNIFKNITKSESSSCYGMLILDGVSVLSMFVGCILSRKLRRKIMLISFSSVGIMVLLLISLYLYLVQISVLENNVYILIVLLVGYSISISIGPMILCTSIVGELLPLQSRMFSTVIVALTFKFIYSTVMKLSPYCFINLGMHGTFLLYAILSLISIVIIYFFVPETKNKTLQEICNDIKSKEERNEAEGTELMNMRNGT